MGQVADSSLNEKTKTSRAATVLMPTLSLFPAPKNEIAESLAHALIEFESRCQEIVNPLQENEILNLVEHFHEYAEPITSFLERELRFRKLFAEAEEYMNRTGSDYYCFRCHGACTPEHESED